MRLGNELLTGRKGRGLLGLGLYLLFYMNAWALPNITPTNILNCRPLFDSLATGVLSPNYAATKTLIATTEEHIKGLNYAGVIAWKPNEINELHRKLVRFHGVNDLAQPIPKYSKTQSFGPATVNIEELRFSQLGCQNESEGGYSVINNALSFKAGTLKTSDLPRLRVWRDDKGKIWTLDHRRLAAMKLSGVIKTLEVEFVAEEIVKAQRFKFDTRSDGLSIFVRVEKPNQPPMAIVVMDNSKKLQNKIPQIAPSMGKVIQVQDQLTDTTVLSKLFSHYDQNELIKWQSTRGEKHFSNLMNYSNEVASSLVHLENQMKLSKWDNYSRFGAVSFRTKKRDSILAKLLRKDYDAFKNGDEGISNLKQVVASIGDAIGTRITLKADKNGEIDPKAIQGFVDQVCEEIKKGTRVTEIMNYRALGPEGVPYLTETQVGQIVKADQTYRLELQLTNPALKIDPIIVKTGPSAGFETGYTSFHMNVLYKSGLQGELQIRGALMNEASEIQHLIYDLKSGKVLSENLKKNPSVVLAEQKFKKLSAPDKNRVMRYVEQTLIHVRKKEAGKTISEAPKLADDLPQELSFEFLRPHLIHD